MRRKFLLYLILLLIGPAVAFGQVSKQAAASRRYPSISSTRT